MKQPTPQDAIMQAYRERPRRGFDMLYAELADRLVTYARRSFRFTQTEAEDAVHDALLPWVEQPERMKTIEQPFPYIFTSVRHACLKIIRKKKQADAEATEAMAVVPEKDHAQSLDIQHALAELPEEQREAIVLRIWGNLTLKDVAEIQEVSVQTVASRYRYGLAKIKEVMA